MDPNLEGPSYFSTLHGNMITYLQETLQPILPEHYDASSNERTWIESAGRTVVPDLHVTIPRGRSRKSRNGAKGAAVAEAPASSAVVIQVPEVEIRETYLEVYVHRGRERRLVTLIEVLSPTNKTAGHENRETYRKKQNECLDSGVNLVEIDLLRRGAHTTAILEEALRARVPEYHDHVCIRRFDRPDEFVVFPILLTDRLPAIPIPLLPEDGQVTVDLQAVFDRCYDAGPYRKRINYRRDRPEVPLDRTAAAWAKKRIAPRA